MPNFRGLGAEVEDKVADYLLGNGYTIVTRRYSVRGGEIDLIALDGEMLVFVEVKYRTRPAEPADIVGKAKTDRLARAANIYMQSIEEPDRPCRLDLVVVSPKGIVHYQDAGSDA